MRKLLQIGAWILGIIILVILFWEFIGTFKAQALGSEIWYYQHKVPVITYKSDDTDRLAELWTAAFVEQLDPMDFGIAPDSWRAYSATWFHEGHITHWFTVENSAGTLCYLLTFDEPHLYQPTSAISANCIVLEDFQQAIIREMMSAIQTPTPEAPQG